MSFAVRSVRLESYDVIMWKLTAVKHLREREEGGVLELERQKYDEELIKDTGRG